MEVPVFIGADRSVVFKKVRLEELRVFVDSFRDGHEDDALITERFAEFFLLFAVVINKEEFGGVGRDEVGVS